MQIPNHRHLSAVALVIGSAMIVSPLLAEAHPNARRSFDHLPTAQDSVYAVQVSEGEVTFDVQPRWEDGALFVDVEATTHSMPLESLDLTAQVRLIIGTDSFAPDEAGELSGHHGSTTLEFRMESRPAEFSIEIRDVPDVPLRTLTWPAVEPGQQGSDDPLPSAELGH